MIVEHYSKVEQTAVESINYKGKTLPVTSVKIQWLSKTGQDAQGHPRLRFAVFHGRAGRRDSCPQPFLRPDHVHSDRPV